jgi:sugar phosphate permease
MWIIVVLGVVVLLVAAFVDKKTVKNVLLLVGVLAVIIAILAIKLMKP